MGAWHRDEPRKFPPPRTRTEMSDLLTAPDRRTESGRVELDLMRCSFVNLRHECDDIQAVVEFVRTSNAPFTGRDLEHLEDGLALVRAGLKDLKKGLKHTRKWTLVGTLEED